jgi:hypothetical protein
MTLTLLSSNLVWLAAGLALGGAYFALLGRTVAAIEGAADWRGAALWLGVRVALAAGVLALAAMQGAVALIWTLLGFLAARAVAIWRVKRQD